MRVLGISPLHDSTVAVINDGELELFFKEERYSRIKRDGPPILSLQKVFEKIPGKIDHACIAAPTYSDPCVAYISTQVRKILGCPVTDYSHYHHLCHAGLAFFNSGFDESLVFVIDRNGSIIEDSAREAESIFQADYTNGIQSLHKNLWIPDIGSNADLPRIEFLKNLEHQRFTCDANNTMSIVKVYESATALIGERPLENGKTMGLAAYGKDQPFVDFFYNGKPLDHLFVHGNFVLNDLPSPVFKDYVSARTDNVTKGNYEFYSNYAYQVQKQTQAVVLEMIRDWVEKTGIKNVCLSGGYALNVVANEFFIRNLPDVNFYFEPLADDSGNSIGAAMLLYRNVTDDKKKYSLTHTFFHGETQEIDPQLGESCTAKDIAELLSEQKTVGVFYGLAEAGPRALGHRSILFDARNKDAKEIVNLIKRREWYRPFAAMILEDEFSKYFDTVGLDKSEAMTVSFQVKLPAAIPGVVHVDNTCRVQTVSENLPHIHELLNEFKKITDVPVLLNTSFNIAGEALVETVEDAIRTFETTELDILWFPETNRLLRK